ncbi:hypothetical protein [Porcipelethomonas sp.]|uniref:hypothetical protein n=1 Tax=Porcipelethomonas sp. TaxID=2981675 RepID=UPI003EF310DB
MGKYLDSNGLLYLWSKITSAISNAVSVKVNKEDGKELSSNDYTDEEKAKLADLKKITVDSEIDVESLNPVENKAVSAALETKADKSLIGSANGIASLDADGKVPSSQLPSYVDDVVEGYYYSNNFYTDSSHTNLITGETSKIYVDMDTNLSYRFGGNMYVLITSSDMTPITNAEIDTISAG